MVMRRRRLSTAFIAVALALVALVPSTALADQPVSHSGSRGVHGLIDSAEFPAATCRYDSLVQLRKFVVRAPIVYARDTGPGIQTSDGGLALPGPVLIGGGLLDVQDVVHREGIGDRQRHRPPSASARSHSRTRRRSNTGCAWTCTGTTHTETRSAGRRTRRNGTDGRRPPSATAAVYSDTCSPIF